MLRDNVANPVFLLVHNIIQHSSWHTKQDTLSIMLSLTVGSVKTPCHSTRGMRSLASLVRLVVLVWLRC